jgi:uncharacterized membrane protein YphA (DoxX/SURF4 family)
MQEECPGKVTGFIVKCWSSLLVCDRWDGDGWIFHVSMVVGFLLLFYPGVGRYVCKQKTKI